jgi:hypothetical protein
MIGNLSFAVANVTMAATVLAIIAVAAVAIRPVVAASDQPLGRASALALSAGGFGLIIFLFAAMGWIGRPLWWVFAALLHLGITGGLMLATRRPPRLRLVRSPGWWRVVPALAYLAWVIAFDLLKCFEPSFGADALLYHLTLPDYWVKAGGLRPHPTLTVAGYPLLIEMIYTVPISHSLPFATRMIHLAFGVGVVLAIYGWLRGRLSPVGAMTFAAAFFIFDSVNEVAAWAHTDLARTFFLVCAAACLATYADRGEQRNLVIAAVLSGLAMSTHYMTIVFGNGLFTIAFAATMAQSRASMKRIARDLAIFWLVSLAVFAPWLLKNLFHYGQPFYGLAGTNFRLPSSEVLTRFFFGNVFFVGFGLLALWIASQPESERGERLLAVYLLAYFVVGAFEIPPIARFFLPLYAVGLMVAGRAAAPFLGNRRTLEVILAVALLAVGIATTRYQWRMGLYAVPVEFLLHNKPAATAVIWHQ